MTEEWTLRQRQYLEDIVEHYERIVPTEKRDLWCLLFGSNILYTATSEEEAKQKRDGCPSVYLCIVPPHGIFKSHGGHPGVGYAQIPLDTAQCF